MWHRREDPENVNTPAPAARCSDLNTVRTPEAQRRREPVPGVGLSINSSLKTLNCQATPSQPGTVSLEKYEWLKPG